MRLWALVPVKPLDQAKSRLARALTPDERASLVRSLLERTLGVLREIPTISDTIVVTADEEVGAWASAAGSHVEREPGEPDLNRALQAATRSAQADSAEGVLVVHGDLPLVLPVDLEAMISAAIPGPTIVVAPDRHGHGTNALLCAPPGLIEYQFGPDSYALHCAQAQAAGARLEVCMLPGLALDLDTPEDLRLLLAASPGWTSSVPRAGLDTQRGTAETGEMGGHL